MLGTRKAHTPQRSDENKRRRDGYESRKKLWDSSRLNPKSLIIGNQQRSPKQGNVQRLSVSQATGEDSRGA